MLEIIAILLFLLVAGSLIYLATLDGNYEVTRTRLIETDINTVFDKVRDFRTWAAWSPWLMHEPTTKLIFSERCSEEGGYYTWDGQRVGAGKLSHEWFEKPRRIEQRLQFTRPFKSVCKVAFEFTEKEDQTEVAWIMDGKMPFLFRFMAKKTADMIGKDYDLGLAMLTGVLDPKAEYPAIQFDGEATLEPMQTLSKEFEGTIREMEMSMKMNIPKLKEHVEQHHGQLTGAPFTAYHKVSPDAQYFVCDMAVPVAEDIVAGEFERKTLGGGRFFKVSLKGSYEFLDVAWYSAMTHVRMHKLKIDKSRPSLEVYENDPGETSSSNEIQTSLYVPIR